MELCATLKSKIGIFGGSFNPIHNGHIAVAKAALNQLKLDKLILVPSKKQPFKDAHELAAFHHRFTMVWLAIRHDKRMICDDVERSIEGTTYLIATLRLLREKYEGEFCFIMGGDSAAEFHLWKDSEEIRKLAKLVVFPRNDDLVPEDMIALNFPNRCESSTDIRFAVKCGDPVNRLVPEPVARYIEAWELYKNSTLLL